jgi:HNH endonuclease
VKPTNQKFFNDVVLAYDGEECLLWPFSTTIKGYPHMYFRGRWKLVTRLACEYFHGPVPSRRHQAAHSCRERACVNWRHLRWATPSDNERDKIAHGTYQFGELNPMAKLTLKQVLAIWSADGNYREIAERYGVRRETVGRIKRRERWAEFTG